MSDEDKKLMDDLVSERILLKRRFANTPNTEKNKVKRDELISKIVELDGKIHILIHKRNKQIDEHGH